MTGPFDRAEASCDRPAPAECGIRLVKKLPGPMMTASNSPIASSTAGWMRDVGLEPERRDQVALRSAPGRLPPRRASASRRAYSAHTRGLLDADGPDAPRAAEQRAQAVDGGEEVAAVALHHRQQQVAAGVAAEPRVLERRAAATSSTRRASASLRASASAHLQDVARRQHAELVAQLAGAAAAVEHRDDRVDPQPGVRLQAAEQAREAPCRPPKHPTFSSRSRMAPL